jgi:predicted GNAT family acetyltransferase
MSDQALNPVVNDVAGHRFELTENGYTAFADYRRHDNGVVMIPHVEAPVELQGKGAAGRLMAGIAAHARAEGFKIVPTCPYAAAWFQRHPDEADLLA